jgi:hypothetical protein
MTTFNNSINNNNQTTTNNTFIIRRIYAVNFFRFLGASRAGLGELTRPLLLRVQEAGAGASANAGTAGFTLLPFALPTGVGVSAGGLP